MKNGTEIVLADPPNERPFTVVKTIKNGETVDQRGHKTTKLDVDTTRQDKVQGR